MDHAFAASAMTLMSHVLRPGPSGPPSYRAYLGPPGTPGGAAPPIWLAVEGTKGATRWTRLDTVGGTVVVSSRRPTPYWDGIAPTEPACAQARLYAAARVPPFQPGVLIGRMARPIAAILGEPGAAARETQARRWIAGMGDSGEPCLYSRGLSWAPDAGRPMLIRDVFDHPRHMAFEWLSLGARGADPDTLAELYAALWAAMLLVPGDRGVFGRIHAFWTAEQRSANGGVGRRGAAGTQFTFAKQRERFRRRVLTHLAARVARDPVLVGGGGARRPQRRFLVALPDGHRRCPVCALDCPDTSGARPRPRALTPRRHSR